VPTDPATRPCERATASRSLAASFPREDHYGPRAESDNNFSASRRESSATAGPAGPTRAHIVLLARSRPLAGGRAASRLECLHADGPRSGRRARAVELALHHPRWKAGQGWQPLVTSTCVESGGEIAVLDPLSPPVDARAIWDRLDARPPTLAVVLEPDHVRASHGEPVHDRDAFERALDLPAYTC
jgi:hypothetical protein